MARKKIKRTLAYQDPEQRRILTIGQDGIPSFSKPVVILGDPGLGKSVLTQELGEQPGIHYFRAGTFERANPNSLIGKNECFVLDGLDEINSAAPGSAVEAVLRKLSALGNPPFILSCREADWLGAADRVRIEDDYGSTPVLLHLQAFTHDDARTFLAQEFAEIDADGLLTHLADRGIESLYGNPLTLRLLGEVAQAQGPFPETRAELFDRACRVMLKEDNPRHHVRKTEEELLLAAGAICAAQLLCGRIGVHAGPYEKTPREFLNIADITELRFGQSVNDALRTRLFHAEGESRFTHIHRVIAEYLGAKWLVRCFEDGVSQKRIFELFRQDEGVPTSLRGLHAWMAHFSDVLATRCCSADPYAVLRYGDAETLDLDQAQTLLAALKELSNKDPYFRSEDWGRHPASGLIRPELKDDILAIIRAPGLHLHLTALLLEAMVGTTLARHLSADLEAILFDRERRVEERSRALDAIYAAAIRDDWEADILRLLDMNDPHSARLAFEILIKVGLSAVRIRTAVDALFAYLGLAPNLDSREESRHVPDSLFSDADTGRLALWLDELTVRAAPLMRQAAFEAKWHVTRLVRRVVAQILAADHAIQPERIWTWISWLDRNRANDDATKRLVAIFRENRALRARLLEHVLLTPCGENTWRAAFRLGEAGLGLYPTEEDVAGVLKALRVRVGDGRIDVDTWAEVLRLNLSAEGLPAVVRDAAIDAANGDPKLLSVLDEHSKTVTPDWMIRQAREQAKEEVDRQEAYRHHRRELAKRASEIAAGEIHVLQVPAGIYLGHGYVFGGDYDFVRAASPVERLREFLGDDLCNSVLAGFVAVLDRDDLPGASGFVENRRGNNERVAEASMICGVAEMVRCGEPIDRIDRDTLAAVYMAWQHAPKSNDVEGMEIGPALEAVLFTNESEWEAHFRASVEPQLVHNREHIQELYRLAREPRFSELAGRLAVGWLHDYRVLPLSTQKLLLNLALASPAREELRALVVDRTVNAYQDRERMLLWVSTAYVVDFDHSRMSLKEVAADNPDFLWLIRDRMRPNRSDRFSLHQLVFIVEAFGTHWPNVDRPTSTWGDSNPWDASEFIRSTIYSVASLPTPDATGALRDLITNHAGSYADTLKHALALQRRTRSDFEYVAPTVSRLQAVMACGLPETIDDMRVWFTDRIETLQKRIRNSDTNMWEAYWDGDLPRDEDFCRDRLIEHVSGLLPESIRFGPETRMPLRKRVDIALTRNTIKLPIEIKGQWHRAVWNAASDQLDARYAVDWQAEGSGTYIVFWFGQVSERWLPRHPDGLDLPQTPESLRRMLIDRLPEARRPRIDVFVIDVSRPEGAA